MRPLLWKELRENLGWAAILFAGVAVSLGVWAAEELPWERIDESITSDEVLGILLIAAPLGALALGLLQTLPEIQRDAWAFLVHRPVSPTRIFLAKTIVGTGLYLAAVLVPFLLLALWVAAGAPERRVFHPFMLWPGVAIVFASAGLHGAAMLVALRRARWLGTRLLPIALPAGALTLSLTYIFNVSEMPSPGLLLFILAAHAVTTVATWGAFVRGGEASGQPLAARVALGLSLWLAALSILGGLLGLGISVASELMPPRTGFDPGNTFLHRVAETAEWDVPLGRPFHIIYTRSWPGRERVAHWIFDRHGAADQWIQSTPDGTLHGYREGQDSFGRRTFRLVRLAGPDGFREPSAEPPRGFGTFVPARWPHRDGLEPAGDRRRTKQIHREVLVCADGIYDVDFAREEVRLLLAAPEGEPIRAASVERTAEGPVEVAIATDRSVRFFSAREEVVGTVTDEATGERADIRGFFPEREVFTATIPAAMRGGLESSFAVARIAGRSTCVFMTGRDTRTFAPERVFEADASGKVLRRRDGLDGGSESELARAAFIASTTFAPLAIAGAAVLADEVLISGDGPGYLRLSAGARPGWAVGFVAILTLQALACAALAWATARRHGFSRAQRRLVTSIGALLGPAGLVALAGTRDWSPTPACAACGRRRAVSIDECPYCGARLEPPARDGTEVIESALPAEPTGIHSRSIP
jgi:hypothetical protein